jgi:hypothetical protein
LRTCVGDGFGLGGVAGTLVGEDAVFDEHDAEIAEFCVDPVAYGSGEVFFELVDWTVSEKSGLEESYDGLTYELLRQTPRCSQSLPT